MSGFILEDSIEDSNDLLESEGPIDCQLLTPISFEEFIFEPLSPRFLENHILITKLGNEDISFKSNHRTPINIILKTRLAYENIDSDINYVKPLYTFLKTLPEHENIYIDFMPRIIGHLRLMTRVEEEIISIEKASARKSSYKLFSIKKSEDIDINIIAPGFIIIGQCILKCNLKPGETIIIDSNEYVVLKNAVEIVEDETEESDTNEIVRDYVESVHMQSGDWIDTLDRNTSLIGIQDVAGSDGLSASVEYIERFY